MKILSYLLFAFTLLSQFNVNASDSLNTKIQLRDSIAIYAEQFIGTPYKWGGESTTGFDCSGFVLYVFKKFGYKLPHSSAAMGNLGLVKEKKSAETGDIILFQGTQSTAIGHVGIVYCNDADNLYFIHSSSYKGGGVKISKLSDGYYTKRFVKVVDILA